MSDAPKLTSREQSRGEELANSISHGIALLAMVAGTPFLIINVLRRGDAGELSSAPVYLPQLPSCFTYPPQCTMH